MTRHEVGEQQIVQALEDISWRTFRRYQELRYGDLSLKGLQAMHDDLNVRSGYLPHGILGSPQALREAADRPR
ncbi:hypothetical protein [Streptomyces sp. NPDC053048]|uniref:hypothetical protein n=1 Tax=Streptomyces sp. NPDC053048 TaxID=3365694 RepID=UPI0037CD1082